MMLFWAIAAQAQETVLIGLVAPLSGPSADLGDAAYRGADLAVRQWNTTRPAGAPPVQLAAVDDGGTAAGARVAVGELADRHVVAIVGDLLSSFTVEAGQEATSRGLVLVTPTSTNDEVLASALTFRVCLSDGDLARRAAEAALANPGKRAVVVSPPGTYGHTVADEFTATWRREGRKVTASIEAQGAPTAGQVAVIVKGKPQTVFLPLVYSDAAMWAKALRAAGVEAPLIGLDGWDSPALPTLGGSALEGASYISHWSVDAPPTMNTAFVDGYAALYPDSPDAISALSWEATRLLLAGIGRASSLDGPTLARALTEGPAIDGTLGPIRFGSDRTAIRPAVQVTIAGGLALTTAVLPPDNLGTR